MVCNIGAFRETKNGHWVSDYSGFANIFSKVVNCLSSNSKIKLLLANSPPQFPLVLHYLQTGLNSSPSLGDTSFSSELPEIRKIIIANPSQPDLQEKEYSGSSREQTSLGREKRSS